MTVALIALGWLAAGAATAVVIGRVIRRAEDNRPRPPHEPPEHFR